MLVTVHYLYYFYFQNMIKYIFILMLSLFCIDATAQITFSKRFHFGFRGAVFTGLEITGDTFAISGIIVDTLPPYKQGSSLAFFDQSGNLLSSKVSVFSDKTYATWGNVLTEYDNHLYAIGYSLEPEMKGLLIKYNLLGEIVWERALTSFVEPGTFFRFNDFIILNNKLYITGDNLVHQGQTYEAAAILVVYNTEGDLLMTHAYSQPPWSDHSECIVQLNENTIVLGGEREKVYMQDQNYDFQTQLIGVDTLGEELWQWQSPADRIQRSAESMLATPDGGLIVASAIGTEIPVNIETSDIYWDCYLFKLNSELEEEWGITLALGQTNPLHEFKKVIPISDGSGYLVVGVQQDSYGNGDPLEENLTDVGGYIVKVSPEGELLWQRLIIHPDLPTFLELHEINDVAETQDGGFIMVGRSADWTGTEAVPSQGWLLKVDEYGCLVPGCHLVSGEEEVVDNPQPKLLLYPNPVQDVLNVYLGPGALPEHATLRIIDVQGKVHQQRRAQMADATYLMIVEELSVGTYFLQLVDQGGRVLGVEQFVKS
ncbi:MAG: hypothetical protein DHS20C18_36590 [Saprospiraceae bacterium]|nr:MAG: hypothetical protein DHS20C18_36590 [Saprospiraceae bacterium]